MLLLLLLYYNRGECISGEKPNHQRHHCQTQTGLCRHISNLLAVASTPNIVASVSHVSLDYTIRSMPQTTEIKY
jgi:hypothetical protein